MSNIEDPYKSDLAEDTSPTSQAARIKSKAKPPASKSKIPVLDSTLINSHTYEYDKLMSLVSPTRAKGSVDFESRRFISIVTPKRPAADVADRLLNYQQLSDNRNRFKKIEKEQKEMENCTFSPKINSSDPRRTFSKFLEHQNDFQKIKRTKIEKKKNILCKEKQGKDDLSPKIEISPGSQKIIQLRKNKKSVHERLYEESRVYKKSYSLFGTEAVMQSFSPDIKSNKDCFFKHTASSEVFTHKSPSVCIALKRG